MHTHSIAIVLSITISSTAFAGMNMPVFGGPMKHIGVHLHGNALEAHVDHSVSTPLLQNYGETYMGNASVLNGTMYNAQYGWMVEGFWSPPVGASLWIEQIDATPGLQAYSGGTMMNPGTFAPIFGTAGSASAIQWSGSMLHNWYAVTAPGTYSATYRIFFADAFGVELSNYESDEVTLTWTAVPTPSALSCLALLALGRRRRH
jgi:hypothetical protein